MWMVSASLPHTESSQHRTAQWRNLSRDPSKREARRSVVCNGSIVGWGGLGCRVIRTLLHSSELRGTNIHASNIERMVAG